MKKQLTNGVVNKMATYKEIPLYVLSRESFEIKTKQGRSWTPQQIIDAVYGQDERNQKEIGNYKSLDEARKALKEHAKDAWTRESSVTSGWIIHGEVVIIEEETCYVEEGEEPSWDNVFCGNGMWDYIAEAINIEEEET